jgi:hypothetical protein
MALTLKTRREVSKETAGRYEKARKREKTRILDEYVSLTGYTRHHAAQVLARWGRRSPPEHTRYKPPVYDSKVFEALRKVWLVCDSICGKRLAPYLAEIVPVLVVYNELKVDTQTRDKLLRISAATIDRLLAPEKAKYVLKPRGTPIFSLLNRIPVKTFSEWDRSEPGHEQVDLVEHNGGDSRGEYANTVVLTDVCTSWTQMQAVLNKAQVRVFSALEEEVDEMPFEVVGLHSDGGKEFINGHLKEYCEDKGIAFTHSRRYKKNDNCYVEQKNGNIVRRAVGYARYSGEKEVKLLNELYASLKPYVSFFQPVMKLEVKTRLGSKVTKRYDKAKTPYQRVLDCDKIDERVKETLRKKYRTLNPAELKREIARCQERLLKYASRRRGMEKYDMDKQLISGRI